MKRSIKFVSQSLLRSRVLIIAIVLAFCIAFPLISNSYSLYLAKLAGIGIILALGTNIFFGYCGQINLGVAAFYAIGAYTSTLLQLKLGLHFFASLPIALLVCLIVAIAVGIPLLRLRFNTLALGTVALGIVTYISLNTWIDFTGGEDGLAVPASFVFGYKLDSIFFYYLILVSVVICYFMCNSLVNSRIGRAMRAIRADETAALSMGINSYHYRMLAYIINGIFAGLAGALFAQDNGWVNPATFQVWTNILIMLMVVVGGAGSNLGAMFGGATMMLLPQLLGSFQQFQTLIYGVLLALILRFLPTGISGMINKFFSRFVPKAESG